jgi:hypothetical protein
VQAEDHVRFVLDSLPSSVFSDLLLIYICVYLRLSAAQFSLGFRGRSSASIGG